jgi:ligand-binding sensor domain-containing protein
MTQRLLLFFLLISAALTAQPHPAWRHYTLNDGLPDNVIYDMCEDSIGRLYFATNSGICRFDGYRFQRFPGREEINAVSVFFPQVDELNRVWFRIMSGEIYYVENDSIYPWQYNHLLDLYKGKYATSIKFSLLKNCGIQVQLNSYGFIEVDKSGNITEFAGNGGAVLWIERQDNSHQLISANKRIDVLNKVYGNTKYCNYIHIVKDRFLSLDTIACQPYMYKSGIDKGVGIGKKHYLFFTCSGIYEVLNGKQIRAYNFTSKAKKNPAKIIQLKDGRFWMPCTENQGGLYIYKDVDALMTGRPDTILLPGIETTSAHFDKFGGLWVTSHQNGIYFLPNPNIAIFDRSSGLENDAIQNLAVDKEQNLYFSNGFNNVFTINSQRSGIRRLPGRGFSTTIQYLYFNSENKTLIKGGDPLFLFQNGKWHDLTQMTALGKASPASHALVSTKKGSYYYGLNAFGIDKLDTKDFSFIYRSNQTKNLIARISSIVETPDERIWVAKNDGLFEWFKDSILRPVANRPEPLTHRLRQLSFTDDGTLIAATASGGLCFWKENQWFQKATETNGLTSNNVSCFTIQGDSIVWAGGNAGLNKITGWRPGEKMRVEQITMAHGLPSNQINQLCIADAFLWIATPNGLVRLGEMPKKLPPQRPYLAEIIVNNQKWVSEKDAFAEFQPNENDLEFRFFALNYRQNGRILYRFRLHENARWQTGILPSARFSSLAPGSYHFEVQAQNEDGLWGASTVFSFEVHPPWWASWPFKVALVLIFMGSVFAFYKWRTHQLKAKFVLQKQLSELEQTALRAQMNPHFIANCLNSIQRCVLENQNEAAVLYIARFGKLTRAAFEFSGRPLISLSEELTYLEHYLQLEKLRFKDRFNFTISVSDAIDPQNTFIAPMLVQPILENSIKHAFTNQNKGARLEVTFSKKENGLEIRCLDNGRGLPEGFSTKSAESSNHALSILQKRFDLLAKTGQQCNLTIKNRPDDTMGTLVVLLFQSQ